MPTKKLGLLGVLAAALLMIPMNGISLGNPDIFYSKAQELEKAGKTQEALKMYDKALSIKPTHFDSLFAAAKLLYTEGEYQKAVLRFDKMTKYYPKDPPALIYMGFAQLKLGKYRDARANFLTALSSNPDSALALIGAGQAEQTLGNGFTANEYYKRALALRPEDEELKETIAQLSSDNQRSIEASQRAEEQMKANRLNLSGSSSYTATGRAPRTQTGAVAKNRAVEAQMFFDIMGMNPPSSGRRLNRSGARGQSGKSRLGVH